jgi:hypothetical protein
MLEFLNALFSHPSHRLDELNPTLTDQALERAIDGTDPRIRALDHYRERLRGPIDTTIRHIVQLIAALPAPIPFDLDRFSELPFLRALFVTPRDLEQCLIRLTQTHEYQDNPGLLTASPLYGLMTVEMEDRRIFGMEVVGDHLQRDVIQETINFKDQTFLGLGASEDESRRRLRICAFDYLVEQALTCQTRQRMDSMPRRGGGCPLTEKLTVMQQGYWGLGLSGSIQAKGYLEADIQRIQSAIRTTGHLSLPLEDSLDCLIEVFSRPEDYLEAETRTLHIDLRGIRQASPVKDGFNLDLSLIKTSEGASRIVQFGTIPRTSIRAALDRNPHLGTLG